jgi:hypothetical protein
MIPPLTPPDCDLLDWPKMMIHISRLRGSSFDAKADDTAWRAGVNLWLSSWHQVPAASLSGDDEDLANRAQLGRDLKTWRKIKDRAMHGWVLCTDGRYYHPVVAETVLECWINKLLKRLSSGYGNAKRHGAPFDADAVAADIRTAAEMLARLAPRSEVLKKPAVAKARAGLPVGVPLGEENEAVGRPAGSQGKGREGKNPPKAPQGAHDLPDFQGPDEVKAIVRAALGESADRILRAFTWRDVPARALVTTSATMRDKLKPCLDDLLTIDIVLLVEKVRAA